MCVEQVETDWESRGRDVHAPVMFRPFLSEHASQLLVDYCNALLAGLPANSIRPLQLIQNAAARLIFNELKRMHVSPVHQFALATNSSSHKIQCINV